MIALAHAIARAEIRPSRFVLATCGLGLATAMIGLAAHPAGAYPVLTVSVRELVYLGAGFMAAGAILAVRATESGVAQELFLSGIGPTQRRRATALVAVGACSLAWLCGSVVSVAVAGPWLGEVTLLDDGSGSVLWLATIGWLSVGLLALVGCACGVACRSRVSALAAVAILSGTPLLMVFFGDLPPALWFRSLFPTGAVYAMLERYEGIRGEPWFRWGVPSVYLLFSAWLVAMGRRRSDPGSPRAARRGPPGRGARSAQAATAAVLLVSGATALGLVAPQRIARAIPWWLHGTWLADVARDRASAPVAEAYVEAVLAGNRALERRLVVRPEVDALDPVVRREVRRAGRIGSVRYVYASESPPGTVVVTLLGSRRRLDLTVCNTRTRRGWRVAEASTDGRC